MNSEVITVGTTGTQCVGSDRYAMVVIDVLTPKHILVSRMCDEDYRNYKLGRIDGEIMVKSGKYNKNSGYFAPTIFSFRKNGRWYPVGSSSNYTGAFWPGEAENYRDLSF